MSDAQEGADRERPPVGATPPPPPAPPVPPAPPQQQGSPAQPFAAPQPPAASAPPQPFGAPAAPSQYGWSQPQTGQPFAAPTQQPVGAPQQPFAAPAGQPFGTPAGQPFGSAPGARPGWAPPPKPGLVPLRPMTLGTLLGASFQVLRRNPRPTFGASLLLQGLVAVISGLLVGFVAVAAFNRVENADPADYDAVQAGSVGILLLSSLVPAVLSLIVTSVLQGVIVLEVARGTLGEKLRFRELVALARGRIGALIGWAFVLTLAVLLAIGLLLLLVIPLMVIGGGAGVAIGVIVGILGTLALVVLYAWLSTRLAFVPSAIVLERLPLLAAVRRSWTLVGGYFWRTFGIILLVAVIVNVIANVVSVPVTLLAPMLILLVDPTGANPALAGVLGVAVLLLTLLVTVAFVAAALVVQSATTALLYLDLRMRKEGLDLDLQRFVEARQAGATDAADPFRPRDAARPQGGRA
ncbi:glycerophosphoryl diester phosphodiesterase membrane domain-containing protein [Herbiconiux sp. SYSU D00978]|uniref:glycerophosphoryl diester phosphodiesterase membrane domain-containing protein n=1 Tax=Herbiconiux sp. SYSU D00978 TaxID=2812562 RepID=UPI0027DBDB0A|nr:glycerophosphoryl diester phosphodiesterase membrane domain-containing protein [Herbiconiux sp. SYSU D00978]